MSQMTICLLIFLFMAVAFFTNKIPMCFTSMIVLLLLVFTGCVDGKEAIATFGSSTVITMVSMYIVAAGLSRTQMIKKISGTLLKVTNGSFTKILATYIIATCILGQFVPSLVATFAMVTPLVLNVCDQMHISPTKMIFPIAVAVVGVSFVIIPIGPYAADYVMYIWSPTVGHRQHLRSGQIPRLFSSMVLSLLLSASSSFRNSFRTSQRYRLRR